MPYYKVDISAFVDVYAKDADDAWAMVNGMFSPWFYQRLRTEGIAVGEISIDEAYLDESYLD